jgi:hypothetical protein
METSSGAASVVINQPVGVIFDAIADVTRMGAWSPENTACRWTGGATGLAVCAKFEVDNEAKFGPITVKKWTTVSEVTTYEPGEIFAFVADEYTTWRYEPEAVYGGTRVTESYEHPSYEGLQGFMYETLGRRSTAMPKAMQQTLNRIKAALES